MESTKYNVFCSDVPVFFSIYFVPIPFIMGYNHYLSVYVLCVCVCGFAGMRAECGQTMFYNYIYSTGQVYIYEVDK